MAKKKIPEAKPINLDDLCGMYRFPLAKSDNGTELKGVVLIEGGTSLSFFEVTRDGDGRGCASLSAAHKIYLEMSKQ